jgi:putative glutamine amidotransferase
VDREPCIRYRAKLAAQFRSRLELPHFRVNATIRGSMAPAMTAEGSPHRPLVGIPWRTSEEQRSGNRAKLDYYFQAVHKAGADAVEISLEETPEQLQKQIRDLDGFVLPGSPADVDPSRYAAVKHARTNTLDSNRDSTDNAILTHAFHSSKPVLAICYGCQILNVHLKGTLIQDIPAEKPGSLPHGNTDLPARASKGDLEHEATLAPNSRLAAINSGTQAKINSSHHQAIDRPGENLRVTAQAPDGIIEAVEWTGDSNWVVGVQWHPERMRGDVFAEALFRDFVAATQRVLAPRP